MSGKITIEDTRLSTEQGVAVVTKVTVENATLEDVVIYGADGVGEELNVETGELTLIGYDLGEHQIMLGLKDEDPQDVVVLTVGPGKPQSVEKEDTIAKQDEPVKEPEAVVETSKAPEPPPVVEQPKATVAAPVAPQQSTKEVPANVSELMRVLEEYKAKMDLRALVPTELGIAQQQKLFKILVKVLNKEGVDFTTNMNALLAFVKENRTGVFSERAINRFIPQVKMNKEEIQLFTRLTAMLITTADVEDKKLVSTRIDFRYIEQRLRNGKAMHQLINYFNPASE